MLLLLLNVDEFCQRKCVNSAGSRSEKFQKYQDASILLLTCITHNISYSQYVSTVRILEYEKNGLTLCIIWYNALKITVFAYLID